MKKILSLIILVFVSLAAFAQTGSKSGYEAFLESRRNAFKAYADSRNARYAEFMKRRWREAEISTADTETPQPSPVIPVRQPDAEETPSVPATEVPTVPQPSPAGDEPAISKPLPPSDEPTKPQLAVPVAEKSANNDVFEFSFFGTDCRVPKFDMQRPALENCTEESVAALWEKFAASGYASVINECSKLKKILRLNDWGYLRLLASLADAWYSPDSDEATLLRTFLAVQSGYEVRIAQSSGHLLMLFPCNEQIYRRRYVSLDGTRYYMFDTRGNNSKCRVFDKSFGGGNRISLRMTEIPHLADKPSPVRILQSKKYPNVKMDATINMNLIDYFDLYPNCDLEIYRIPTFSGSIADGLESMKQAIALLDAKNAVAMILDFVQTAFDYQTDAEQFGYERSFFAEETFYYPYCDCEDRAILFSSLVENLTGLGTVLLQYTGHVAAAVCFDNDVAGDFVTVNGRRYIVCDPTYIGAGIGCSMPGLDNKSISIVTK